MKIKSTLTAVAVAFSVALLSTPGVHAAEENTDRPKETTPTIVTVQAGDTLTSIAEAHETTYVALFNANEAIASPDAIDIGDEVRIPTADEELPDRFGQYAATLAVAAPAPTAAVSYEPVYSQTYTPGSQAVYATDSAGNTYFKGYCTWYVKDRRPDLPNMLGNGGEWAGNAAARGFTTGSTPQVGAVAETNGHVAYVEAVNGDGTITISEMNGTAGFGNVGTRTVPASSYNYIY